MIEGVDAEDHHGRLSVTETARWYIPNGPNGAVIVVDAGGGRAAGGGQGIVGCSSGDASWDFANFGRGVITSESPRATSVNPFPFLILNLCQLNRCHPDRPATSEDDNHRLNVDKGRRKPTYQHH